MRNGYRVLDVTNNAPFSRQKAEDFIFIGLCRDDLNNRFPVFCDHHGPAALGDLVHHGEALRFELGSWNLLHEILH